MLLSEGRDLLRDHVTGDDQHRIVGVVPGLVKVEQVGRGQGLEVFFDADDRVIIGSDPAQICAQEVGGAGGGVVLPPLAVFLQHHAFLVLQLVGIGVEAVHQDGVEDEEGLQMLGPEPGVVGRQVG